METETIDAMTVATADATTDAMIDTTTIEIDEIAVMIEIDIMIAMMTEEVTIEETDTITTADAKTTAREDLRLPSEARRTKSSSVSVVAVTMIRCTSHQSVKGEERNQQTTTRTLPILEAEPHRLLPNARALLLPSPEMARDPLYLCLRLMNKCDIFLV
jgi:hypothetical protein